MRIAILGAGTVACSVFEHLRRGELPGVEVVGIASRAPTSRGAALAAEFGAR